VEKITLSVNLVNQLLGYLGSRPYQEVFQIVEAVQKEAQNQPKDEPIEIASE
jgi:hypothetical protein